MVQLILDMTGNAYIFPGDEVITKENGKWRWARVSRIDYKDNDDDNDPHMVELSIRAEGARNALILTPANKTIKVFKFVGGTFLCAAFWPYGEPQTGIGVWAFSDRKQKYIQAIYQGESDNDSQLVILVDKKTFLVAREHVWFPISEEKVEGK